MNWKEDSNNVVMKKLGNIFNEILKCKKNGNNCPQLKRRELFFEPSLHTLTKWREDYGFYNNGIDRRVVFVCESPGRKQIKDKDKKFWVDDFEGWQCYNSRYHQDERFRKVRGNNGFQHCYITNTVKCGVRDPKKKMHYDDELKSCSKFLIKELAILRPIVVACVGDNAFFATQNYVMPYLSFSPVVVKITHYSFRGDPHKRWDKEFKLIKQCLKSRNHSETKPLF